MSSVEQVGNAVSFRLGIATWLRFSFGFRLRGLATVSSGTIEVVPGDPGHIRFEASSALFATFCTAVILLMSFDMLRVGEPELALLFAPLGWLWIVGLNYLFGRAAVRDWVATVVNLEGQAVGSRVCPSCGTRYNPSDYRNDAREKRCDSCGGLLEPTNDASSSA